VSDFASSLHSYVSSIWADYIVRYFTTPPSTYVKLRAAVWYGYMESGKTYSDGVLEARLKARTHLKRVYIVTNNIVYTLYDVIYGELYRDLLRDAAYIDIFFDDALIIAHSLERRAIKVATDKVISVLRHIIARRFKNVTATLRIATQKYTILNPLLRNAPVIFIKSMPNDAGDANAIKGMIKSTGAKKTALRLLRDLTAAIYVSDEYKAYTLAIVSGRLKLVKLAGTPAEPDIHHRYSHNIYEEEFVEMARRLIEDI